MRKPTFQTKRQRKRKAIRSLYGNPWDSTSSSSRRSSSNRSASNRSALKRNTTSKKRVTFRQPIERSASKSHSSGVWRTVSSEKK